MLDPFMLDQLHRRRRTEMLADHLARQRCGRLAILRPFLAIAVGPQAMQGEAEIIARPALEGIAGAAARRLAILRAPADGQRIIADRQHALGFIGARPLHLRAGDDLGQAALIGLGMGDAGQQQGDQGQQIFTHGRNPVRCRRQGQIG